MRRAGASRAGAAAATAWRPGPLGSRGRGASLTGDLYREHQVERGGVTGWSRTLTMTPPSVVAPRQSCFTLRPTPLPRQSLNSLLPPGGTDRWRGRQAAGVSEAAGRRGGDSSSRGRDLHHQSWSAAFGCGRKRRKRRRRRDMTTSRSGCVFEGFQR